MRWRIWTVPALLVCLQLSAATYPLGNPGSTNNDDSCDIANLPAATLLVPLFQVDLADPAGQTTLVTVTNVSPLPQIARVTLWTDFAFPVLAFSLLLTGYDVQSLNLRDVLAGRIAQGAGTPGSLSSTDNPNADEASCQGLVAELPPVLAARMQQAFTTGKVPELGGIPGCTNIGGAHQDATGYLTIDVTGTCSPTRLPTDDGYFSSDIRFDNVLIGDWMQVDPANESAQVSPMVHLRAVGEESGPTNLRRTFYSRFQPAATRTADRRQPLPSVFAARWISGGAAGFETHFKIWREGKTGAADGCDQYARNGALPIEWMVRFDEDENPETYAPPSYKFPDLRVTLPAASITEVSDWNVYPANTYEGNAGWMWMTLDNDPRNPDASQNWVVVSMRAENRFSGDMDAQALGNGCSPQVIETIAAGGTTPIGPAPNPNP